jgi:hypothetical protein
VEVRRRDQPGSTLSAQNTTLRAVVRTIIMIVAVCCALGVAGARAECQTIALSLGSANITFANASPGSSGSIAANENPISVSITVIPSGTNWTLTVLANGDLISGADTVAISNVTWTATGASFVGGTLSKTSSHSVGSGLNSRSGTLSFSLANSWSYPTGTYTQTITFTATGF